MEMKPSEDFIYRMTLAVGILLLAGIVGLGKVEKDTSYGLEFLMGALVLMADRANPKR